MGRTPSARVPLDPLYAKRKNSLLPKRPTRASAADQGVRPTSASYRALQALSVAIPTYRLEAVVVEPKSSWAALIVPASEVRQSSSGQATGFLPVEAFARASAG